MEDPSGGGEIAAGKRTKAPSDSAATGVDRLSALPDDMLVKILLFVSSPDAVRTCVLSRRWRSVWKVLPDLHLPFLPEPAGSFRDALKNDQVPLQNLKVEGHGRGQGGLPRSIATWLPAAAGRVSGGFSLLIDEAAMRDARHEDEAAAIELPCFECATSISIGLRFRGRLAFLPPADAGVFSRLADLWLEGVWFQDPSALGDAISSARCPCLQTFHLCHSHGLEKLAMSSTSLVKLELELVHGLRELLVDAPELTELHVVTCFSAPPEARQPPPPPPVVSIAAPGLVVLEWRDGATQDTLHVVHRLPHLRSLGTFIFFVYGDDDIDSYNRDCLRILQGFRSLETLTLVLAFLDIEDEDYEYLMEAMTVLPDLTTLHLIVMPGGHCIGNGSLHVLRICTGIRKLVLELSSRCPELEATCPSGCICRQQANWRTEELALVCLQEIEIQGFGQSDHDIGFVEQLFGWATSLTKATIFFDESVTEGVAEELCWMFQFFATPKLHIDFRYHNNKVVDAPEE